MIKQKKFTKQEYNKGKTECIDIKFVTWLAVRQRFSNLKEYAKILGNNLEKLQCFNINLLKFCKSNHQCCRTPIFRETGEISVSLEQHLHRKYDILPVN